MTSPSIGDRLTGLAQRGTTQGQLSPLPVQAPMPPSGKPAQGQPKIARGSPPIYLKKIGWTKGTDPFVIEQAAYIDQILSGITPFQAYLQPNGRLAKVDGSLTVEPKEADFRRELTLHAEICNLKQDKNDSKRAEGYTDKLKGKIKLIGKNNTLNSTVEIAMHEGLHLFSYPPGGGQCQNEFRKFYGSRLDEGVTQYFTERILDELWFRPVGSGTKYRDEMWAANALAGWVGEDALAKAYFTKNTYALINALKARWPEKVVHSWKIYSAQGKLEKSIQLLIDNPENL